MTWRPWVIVACLMLGALVNGTLLGVEKIPTLDVGPELVKIEEPLRTLQYLPNNRRANFEIMGMTPDLADAAAVQISRWERQGERLVRLMEEQSPELTDVFCPSERLPQPYAALRYLVEEENGVRTVVDPIKLRHYDTHEWYDRSLVPALYDHFERTQNRKPDATLMGVSAVLVGREMDALDGTAPWSLGLVGSWGFSRLVKKQPRVQTVAIEYFALMHFLTEMANSQRGICS